MKQLVCPWEFSLGEVEILPEMTPWPGFQQKQVTWQPGNAMLLFPLSGGEALTNLQWEPWEGQGWGKQVIEDVETAGHSMSTSLRREQQSITVSVVVKHYRISSFLKIIFAGAC